MKELAQELRDNRVRLTEIILKQYSEINKGELIVAAGAFSLIVNFLIRDSSQSTYQKVCILKISVVLLAATLVLKFLISRLSADFATKEQDSIDERMNLIGEALGSVLRFEKSGDKNDIVKSREYFSNAEKIESNFKNDYKPFIRKYGKEINWIEFLLFSAGILMLVIFFMYNV